MGSCKTGKKLEHFAGLGPKSSHIYMALWSLSTLHNCDALPRLVHNTINNDAAMQVSYVWPRICSSVCVVSMSSCSFKWWMGGGEDCWHLSGQVSPFVTSPDPGPRHTALQRLAASSSIKCCRSISDISSVDQCRPLHYSTDTAHYGEKLSTVTVTYIYTMQLYAAKWVWCLMLF